MTTDFSDEVKFSVGVCRASPLLDLNDSQITPLMNAAFEAHHRLQKREAIEGDGLPSSAYTSRC